MAATPPKCAAVDDVLASQQAMTPHLSQGHRTHGAAEGSTNVHEPSGVEDGCGPSSTASSMRRRQLKIQCPRTPSTSGHRRSVQGQPLKCAFPPLTRPSLSTRKRTPPAKLTSGHACFCQVGKKIPQKLQRRSGCAPSAFSQQAKVVSPQVACHRSPNPSTTGCWGGCLASRGSCCGSCAALTSGQGQVQDAGHTPACPRTPNSAMPWPRRA